MRLIDALANQSLDRPPIWFMRQAGRYLPEYLELRQKHTFQEAVHNPAVAAEITLQPTRRFELDAAIIFSDIMTPLEGLGVDIDFNPGPQLRRHTIEEVAAFDPLDPATVDFVGAAISRVRSELDSGLAVIGFAGAPFTLLCYLLAGGGSKEFLEARAALHHPAAPEALVALGRSMNAYLKMQIDAGANVVQLFDSWAGIANSDQLTRIIFPAAAAALDGLDVPTIYFAPAASHGWSTMTSVGASGYGIDWRQPISVARAAFGPNVALQGNLDPAVLLTDRQNVAAATQTIVDEMASGAGWIFNLGHGINKDTPLDNVAAMVKTVTG